MFDWSGKNGDKSGKFQGILISCVSGNPDMNRHCEEPRCYFKTLEIPQLYSV